MVAAVILAVGLLLLLDWLRVFPKGWAVLTAMAAVVLAFFFALFCFAGCWLFRRRFQFSIRTLLLLVFVVAVPCSWMATAIKNAKEQGRAVMAEGAWVVMMYDYEVNDSGEYVGGKPKEPVWLRDLLGLDFFAEVVAGSSLPRAGRYSPLLRSPLPGATLGHLKALPRIRWLELAYTEVADTGLASLKGLHELEHLSLAKTEISDAGLEHLAGLTHLRFVDLRETRVTEEGVKNLRQALPKCKIAWGVTGNPPTASRRESPEGSGKGVGEDKVPGTDIP
jgi:hypothetical protein